MCQAVAVKHTEQCQAGGLCGVLGRSLLTVSQGQAFVQPWSQGGYDALGSPRQLCAMVVSALRPLLSRGACFIKCLYLSTACCRFPDLMFVVSRACGWLRPSSSSWAICRSRWTRSLFMHALRSSKHNMQPGRNRSCAPGQSGRGTWEQHDQRQAVVTLRVCDSLRTYGGCACFT